MIEVAPDAPPEGRSEVAVDIRAHGAGAAPRQGAAAVSTLDVDSRNVLLERFAWARDRGVRGAPRAPPAPHRRRGHAASRPSATVAGLRAQMTGDDRRESRPVNVGLRARLVRAAGAPGGRSTPASRRARARPAPTATRSPPCCPEQPGSLRASLSLPVDGELLAPRPRAERAALTPARARLPPETFTLLVRSESIAGVGGALDARCAGRGGRRAARRHDPRLRGARGHHRPSASACAASRCRRAPRAPASASSGRASCSAPAAPTSRGPSTSRLLAPRPDGAPAPPPSAGFADVRPGGGPRAPGRRRGQHHGWVDGNVDFGMRFARDGARGELSPHHTQVRL